MKNLAWMGMTLLLLASCGDSGGRGDARTANELCEQVCGWPDQCFAELGVPLEDAECVQSCEASVEVVGLPCLRAMNDTISCLGTCDFEMLSDQQILSCQDEAEAILATCE